MQQNEFIELSKKETKKLNAGYCNLEQSNCELSELLQQRNEMLAMLEDIKDSIEGGEAYDLYRIEQLIKKVKDNG
jgi:hypothetical protein